MELYSFNESQIICVRLYFTREKDFVIDWEGEFLPLIQRFETSDHKWTVEQVRLNYDLVTEGYAVAARDLFCKKIKGYRDKKDRDFQRGLYAPVETVEPSPSSLAMDPPFFNESQHKCMLLYFTREKDFVIDWEGEFLPLIQRFETSDYKHTVEWVKSLYDTFAFGYAMAARMQNCKKIDGYLDRKDRDFKEGLYAPVEPSPDPGAPVDLPIDQLTLKSD